MKVMPSFILHVVQIKMKEKWPHADFAVVTELESIKCAACLKKSQVWVIWSVNVG